MSKKINLPDLTFFILYRQDTIERVENILLVTQYLIKNFKTNIEVLQCDPFNNRILKKILDRTVKFRFTEDNDPILFRTNYINRMIENCQTPNIAIWDADVIAPVLQIILAVDLLKKGEADFVYPYERFFLDTSFIIRKKFIENRDINVLLQNAGKMKEMYPPNPVGGAFMVNLEAYKNAGLENINFYGWGLEDGERFYRFENKGFKVKRIPGPLFHLSHSRGINSAFHNPEQQLYKQKKVFEEMRKKDIDYE